MSNEQDKQEFVNAYTRVLVNAWSSEEFSAQLESDPRAALAEAGLEVPEGVEVKVVREAGGPEADLAPQERLNKQYERWTAAEETGEVIVFVPATPRVDVKDLEMSDLESVAGGDFNCCCCPCCCCT